MFLLACSTSYAQKNGSVSKTWQYKGKGKEDDKFMRKAAKKDAKVKRVNQKFANKQKSKGKLKTILFWRRDDKIKALREEEAALVHEGRSRRHFKKQSKKTRKRMRKSLRKHNKLNR